jgi:hypothetical protein
MKKSVKEGPQCLAGDCLRLSDLQGYFEQEWIAQERPVEELAYRAELGLHELDRLEDRLARLPLLRNPATLDPLYNITLAEQAVRVSANQARVHAQYPGLADPPPVPPDFRLQYERHVVLGTDLAKLQPNQDLNDSLINFYMAFLADHPAEGRQVLAFNSFFYDKYTKGGLKTATILPATNAAKNTSYPDIRRWIKKNLF